MKVEHIYEKGVGRVNEDAYFINGRQFGVFDGATSITSSVYENGNTGGYLASTIAKETFSKNGASLKKLAGMANTNIRRAMLKKGIDISDKKGLWSTSAAVVRIDDNRVEWVQTGDCLILAILKNGDHKTLTTHNNHDIETLRMWKAQSHKENTDILAALKPQIAKVRNQMNVRYGSLSGETEALNFINHGSMPLSDIRHLIIFSDGLFIPSAEPENKEDFSLFSELFKQGGLKNIRDHVRRIESTDEQCQKYPRFKKHDDIAAVSLSF